MNKNLLASALLIAAVSASAQSFSDYISATYNGQEIENNSTLVFNKYTDYTAMGLGVSYDQDVIKMANKSDNPTAISGIMLYSQPTKATATSDPLYWGTAAFCYEGAVAMEGSAANSCLAGGAFDAGSGIVWAPAAGTDTLEWHVKVEFANKEAELIYKVVFTVMHGDTASELEDGPSLSFFIKYTTDAEAAVETVDCENAPAVYYDLQGNKVETPVKGLYIKVQGNKAEKILL